MIRETIKFTLSTIIIAIALTPLVWLFMVALSEAIQ